MCGVPEIVKEKAVLLPLLSTSAALPARPLSLSPFYFYPLGLIWACFAFLPPSFAKQEDRI